MNTFQIHLKEKEKNITKLSFANFRDEVVGFMYKKGIVEHTRSDLGFFVLLYFLLLNNGNGKTLLSIIFQEGLSKAEKLNNAFILKKGHLSTGEYGTLIQENNLKSYFQNDIFFILIKSISEIEKIYIQFSSFFQEFPELKKEIDSIHSEYGNRILSFYLQFSDKKIEDTRIDEQGEEHDLSKSVYHMVNMRMSRKIDLSLEQRTEIKEITSQSPLDIIFLQHIDIGILFDLWEKYNLAGYTKSLISTIDNSNIASGTIGGILSTLTLKWWEYKKIGGIQNRIEKTKLKNDFDKLKQEENTQRLLQMLIVIVLSQQIQRAPDLHLEKIGKLEQEVDILKLDIEKNKKEINELRDEIIKRKNLEITVVQNQTINNNTYNIQGSVEQLQNQSENSAQN